MPVYRINLANRSFRSCSDHEQPDDNAAVLEAVRGSISIGADEVCKGEPLFIAEITVEGDGKIIDRRTVAVGSSPLSY